MSKKFDVALFDFDGTIFDTSKGITNAVRYSLSKKNITEYENEVLYKFIGPPLVDSYMKYFNFDYDEATELVRIFREYYRSSGNEECNIYDGIVDVINKLHSEGIRCSVATSKPQFFAELIAKRFNIYNLFECISGVGLDSLKQSKENSIRTALKNMNVNDLDKVVMIGDRDNDILGAKAVGIHSIGVLYGFGSLEELKNNGAEYIADKPQDIYKIIIE